MGKKVVVIGKGGREHAIVEALHKSKQVEVIYSIPGNVGMEKYATRVNVSIEKPYAELIAFSKREGIDLVVIGPEDPLVEGIVDALERVKIPVFGPEKRAAMLEGSKLYAKRYMTRGGIPTAHYKVLRSKEEALEKIEEIPTPFVLKADGLAAGKGVRVCTQKEEAREAIEDFFVRKLFGDAGKEVLLESFLRGEEASFFVLCDGTSFKTLLVCQDHKRAYDGDKGPNTGGMGVYTPVKIVTPRHRKIVENNVVKPLLEELRKDGILYKGVLYVGVMIDGDEVNVVEFNVRFGDPEAECFIPLIETDFYEVLESCVQGNLGNLQLEVSSKASCCVILASEGYPGPYAKNIPLETMTEKEDLHVFHCGTKWDGKKLLSDGGRVFALSAQSPTLMGAIDSVYSFMEGYELKGLFCRKDIGKKGL